MRVQAVGSGADVGDGGGERGLAVVDVPDRPDVEMRLVWGLVFKAHRLLYHLTLGLRVMKKKPSRC